MRCICGANWFLEEKLVRPAGAFRFPQHTPMANQEMPRYRYRCAECGVVYGQEPPPKTAPEPETKPTVSKRKPRPKKTETG